MTDCPVTPSERDPFPPRLVEAVARAICRATNRYCGNPVRCAIGCDAPWANHLHMRRDQEAIAAIQTIDAFRADEKRRNCKHPNRVGSGAISSDGSGRSSWYCPDCHESHESEWPKQAPLTPAQRAPEKPARDMTDDELTAEMERVGKQWDDMRSDPEFEGHCGSPGEWMVERMDEIETERKRRTGRMMAKRKPIDREAIAALSQKIATEELMRRLREIAKIVEAVDNRCMAVDGPVTPTHREITAAEIKNIYRLAKIEKYKPPKSRTLTSGEGPKL